MPLERPLPDVPDREAVRERILRIDDVLGEAGDPGRARELGHDGAVRADRRLFQQRAGEHRAEDPLVPERLADRAAGPRAWSVAIFAQVPVPHGERSMAPVHVDGRFQSSVPVETTTALRR